MLLTAYFLVCIAALACHIYAAAGKLDAHAITPLILAFLAATLATLLHRPELLHAFKRLTLFGEKGLAIDIQDIPTLNPQQLDAIRTDLVNELTEQFDATEQAPAPTQQIPDRLIAKRFTLVDDDGDPCAMLGHHNGEIFLLLKRQIHKTTFLLTVSEDGANAILTDNNGRSRVALSTTQPLSGLYVGSSPDKPNLFVVSDEDDAAIVLKHNHHRIASLLTVDEGLAIIDKTGNTAHGIDPDRGSFQDLDIAD